MGFQGRLQALLECVETSSLQVVISPQIQPSAQETFFFKHVFVRSGLSFLNFFFIRSAVCFFSISTVLLPPWKPPSLSCLEGATAPGDLSFWSVWLIFPLSRRTELQRVCMCVATVSHFLPELISAMWESFFPLPPLPYCLFLPLATFCSILLLFLSHCSYFSFPLFFHYFFHPITFLSLPILVFLCPYFLCLPRTPTHINTHTLAESRSERPILTAVSLSRLGLSQNINAVHYLHNNNAAWEHVYALFKKSYLQWGL